MAVNPTGEMDAELSEDIYDPDLSQGGTQISTGCPKFNSKLFAGDSFSEKAQDEKCPTRDQAIIMTCVDDLTITDYTVAIGKIVKPVNVLCASRVSKNRVCIHLSSKELVVSLTSEYQSVKIKNKTVFIRPLVSPHKRIIFSNVSPTIPNRYLEKILDYFNVNRGSAVTRMKVSISEAGYSHVESHRRQVYVKVEDLPKIPTMFQLTHDDIDFFIYAGPEIMRCYKCKKEGHKAINCTFSEPSIVNSSDIHTSNDAFPALASKQNTVSGIEKTDKAAFKRSMLSSNSSSVASANTRNSNEKNKDTKPSKQCAKKKKLKVSIDDKMSTIDEALKPCEVVFTEENKVPCSFENFVKFYKNTYGQNNLFSEVQNISSNKQNVIDLINLAYPFITVSSVKSKLTKIKNKLSLSNFDENALLSQSEQENSEISDSDLEQNFS